MPQIHIDPEHPSFLWNQSSSNPQKYVLGSMEFHWRLLIALDWFVWENLHRKPWVFLP